MPESCDLPVGGDVQMRPSNVKQRFDIDSGLHGPSADLSFSPSFSADPSAGLPLCLVCGFILSVSPFFTGLSSNLPEDSVRSAVFKIQFRRLMQNIPGSKGGDRLIT